MKCYVWACECWLLTSIHRPLFIIFPSEDVRDGRWSIREATEKIKYPNNKHWKLAFNLEGVTPNERALRTQYKETCPEETSYVSRYDLTFLTPCWYQLNSLLLRCKVSPRAHNPEVCV